MPKSRRIGGDMSRFARSMSHTVQELAFFRERNLNSFIERCDKYCAVNPRNYSRLGTIEFRQHSGTLCPKKIKNWVNFLIAFVEASRPSGSGLELIPEQPTDLGPAQCYRGKRRKLLEIFLTRPFYDIPEQTLQQEVGYASMSALKASITAFRRAGYNIVWAWGQYRYLPTNNVLRQSHAEQVQQLQSQFDNLPELWHNVPDNIRTFYNERTIALSS